METKDEIINRLVQNLAEVITEDEFRSRITPGENLTHYIGFEISGYVHIGQGIMTALVIKDLQALGVKCTIWLADWHTAINKKLDGTKETAAKIGKGYFTEAIKACLLAVGADADAVEFRLASEWYAKDTMKFLGLVANTMAETSLARLQRSISIMGKEAGQEVDSATLLYPAMQVADIFYQNIDIVHAGMDQRKAHVVMRDVANKVMPDKKKPIVLHHPLMMGLDVPFGAEMIDALGKVQKLPSVGVEDLGDGKLQITIQNKMSKSKPDSAIFIHDSEEEINRKIGKAFCPPNNVKDNPVLNWAKNILFWDRTTPFIVKREPEHGGDIEFGTFEQLEEMYLTGNVHPMDLKATVAKEIIELLALAREHFAKPEIAAMKKDLDEVIAKKS